METYAEFPAPDAALLAKWGDILQARAIVNKEIEALRADGKVGSSLQAEITIKCQQPLFSELSSLGDDLKFVLITSAARLEETSGAGFAVEVNASEAIKCDRCWHYRADVGHDPAHPTICGRCTSNLFGAGEDRKFA
jgi:isoleucyl-tRNA synthetase